MDEIPESTVFVLRPPYMVFSFPKRTLTASVLLFLAVSSAYLANSRIIEAAKISRVKVFGRLVCSKTGNHVPGSDSLGLGGTDVALSCQKGMTPMMSTAWTNVSGIFVFEFDLGKLKVVDQDHFSLCEAAVKLPVRSCNLLPTSGTLHSIVGPDYNSLSTTARATTATFVVEEFRHSVD